MLLITDLLLVAKEPNTKSLTPNQPRALEGTLLGSPLTRAGRAVAKAMLLVYVFTVASQALPLQVRNPSWVMGIMTILIQNAIIPLAAVVFVLILVLIAPDEPPNRRLARLIVRFTLPAALGFLFLIPLHLAITTYAIQQSNQALSRDLEGVKERFESVRRDVASAATLSDLAPAQSLLPGESIPTLFSLPLNQARPRIVETLQQVQQGLVVNRRRQHRELRWGMIREAARNTLSSLVIGLAFLATRFGRIAPSLYGTAPSAVR